MEPEDGSNDLLGDDPAPIPTLDMEQFMAEDCVLDVGRLSNKSFGEKHQRRKSSEGDGLLKVRHVTNLGPRGEPLTKARILVGQAPRSAAASEATKTQHAIANPGQPHHDSGGENGHEDLRSSDV